MMVLQSCNLAKYEVTTTSNFEESARSILSAEDSKLARFDKTSNVYADISTNFSRLHGKEWLMLKELMEIVKIWCGNTEKLLFGSDYPFYSQDQTTEIVRDFMKHNELFTVLERSDVDALMNKNAELFCEKYKLWRMKE